jgi:hypothetical protein
MEGYHRAAHVTRPHDRTPSLSPPATMRPRLVIACTAVTSCTWQQPSRAANHWTRMTDDLGKAVLLAATWIVIGSCRSEKVYRKELR